MQEPCQMTDGGAEKGKEAEGNSSTLSNLKKIPRSPVAVALEEGASGGARPRISAAGRGKIAEQILQLAWDNGVPVREDSALAEILAAIELDSPVPSEAFMAVAEILAYVYRANGAPNPFDAVLADIMQDEEENGDEDSGTGTDIAEPN